MSSSIREIGTEQAQDGTSIDGNRLSLMLRTLADRWNAVRSRNVARRWVPITYSGGYTPIEPADGTQDSLPFMGAYNSDKQRVGATPTAGYLNEWRSKGNVVSGINPADPDAGSHDDLLTWTVSFYFRKPARLTGLFVGLVVDAQYKNTFSYGPNGGNIPPGKVLNGSVDDWTISVEVDNPFSVEKRSLSSIVYKRQQCVANAWQFSNAVSAPTSTALPLHPGGELASLTSHDSLMVVDQNLMIEIPRDSRVRLHITIPKYETQGGRDDDYDTGWNSDGVATFDSWQGQTYHWSLHFAEALEQ